MRDREREKERKRERKYNKTDVQSINKQTNNRQIYISNIRTLEFEVIRSGIPLRIMLVITRLDRTGKNVYNTAKISKKKSKKGKKKKKEN